MAGATYSAFDVQPYLTPGQLASTSIDYRVDPNGHLPWDRETFDVVWSYSVLEHVREPGPLLSQVEAVLRPGGRHIAFIDLESHLGGRGDPRRMYEFLRFSPRLWDAMTSNRSGYVNRLRVSEWRAIFVGSGLEILEEEDYEAHCSLESLRAVDYLSTLSDEDLLTRQALFVAGKPARGPGRTRR